MWGGRDRALYLVHIASKKRDIVHPERSMGIRGEAIRGIPMDLDEITEFAGLLLHDKELWAGVKDEQARGDILSSLDLYRKDIFLSLARKTMSETSSLDLNALKEQMYTAILVEEDPTGTTSSSHQQGRVPTSPGELNVMVQGMCQGINLDVESHEDLQAILFNERNVDTDLADVVQKGKGKLANMPKFQKAHALMCLDTYFKPLSTTKGRGWMKRGDSGRKAKKSEIMNPLVENPLQILRSLFHYHWTAALGFHPC